MLHRLIARASLIFAAILLAGCAAQNMRGYQNTFQGYDIPQPLLDRVVQKFRQHGLSEAAVGRDSDWPEALRHAIQRAMRQGKPGVFDEARERFDKTLLEAALELTRGHRVDAAKLLGIGRNTITRKLGSSRNRRG